MIKKWKTIGLIVLLDYFYLIFSFISAEGHLFDAGSFVGRFLIFYLTLYLHFPISILFFGITSSWVVFFYPIQTFATAFLWRYLTEKGLKRTRWLIPVFYAVVFLLAILGYYNEVGAFKKY